MKRARTFYSVWERINCTLTTMLIMMGVATFNLIGCELMTGELTYEELDQEDVDNDTSFSGEFNVVMDVYGKDAEAILYDDIMMHEAVDSDYEFISQITEMGDGWVEVRAKIPQLTVSLNGQTTTLDENGQFTFEDITVEPGDTIAISNDDAEYVAHILTENEVNERTLLIEDVFDYETYVLKDDCNCKGDSCPVKSAARDSYPCLDNNGRNGGFFRSDCYMSLMWGPAQYSWMCWVEAMNSIHDHHGNTWCNGTHNCSLFVHGWRWNCQSWHTHSGSWSVGSGC